METGKKSDGNGLFCSFCGKSEKAVKNLIVQDGANICNECLDACNYIIENDRRKKLVKENRLLTPQEIKAGWTNRL